MGLKLNHKVILIRKENDIYEGSKKTAAILVGLIPRPLLKGLLTKGIKQIILKSLGLNNNGGTETSIFLMVLKYVAFSN